MNTKCIVGLLVLALVMFPTPGPAAGGESTHKSSSATDVDLAVLLGISSPTPAATPVPETKPSRIPQSCYEDLYNYCEWACYGLSQEGRCDFFANQGCLCLYFPADCPVCY